MTLYYERRESTEWFPQSLTETGWKDRIEHESAEALYAIKAMKVIKSMKAQCCYLQPKH